MALVPWEILGSGRFQSKSSLKKQQENEETLRNIAGIFQQTPEKENDRRGMALEKLAAVYGTGSVTAVTLALCFSKDTQSLPHCRGEEVEYLMDNIQALKIRLTDDQSASLESVRDFDIGFLLNLICQDPQPTGLIGIVPSAGCIEYSVHALHT
ncbi:putative aryl-alcohol dehydrogenase AAD16 [Aspergillus bertholletiae]|uniref:Putative aryl-alcohol dehydrogenase AAD16 n=1 Tax=Aspergillus bertholletiae TaxID=1226010 RepID=A0A5N7BJH8_9EURO|nr:putative aryl-alcohol dehydrogenase AAD16 [Aspergillus bertholletiae]